MSNKLSITSRILVAFASGALVTVFFLPAWRIDLFAPQYPEGLTLNIWINGLSGDVDVINGLNHYIGMKHITVSMFPEFRFLPYVVGFYMLLGMAVSISGSRKLLLTYLGLTVVGGILAMYDFYKWGYDYGHNLDPTAPIQVPGLTYQPPLFGHKRLLNFDAYSFPDVGGWVVIGAAILAFGVWFFEWYRHHKERKKLTVIKNAPVLILLMTLGSCAAQPEKFNYGKDVCHTCKMSVIDPRFGSEIITRKGKVFKFDDVNCMNRFLKTGAVDQDDIKQTVVINFEKENDFLPIQDCFFVSADEVRSPMGGNAAAFASIEKATQFSKTNNGRVMTWTALSATLH